MSLALQIQKAIRKEILDFHGLFYAEILAFDESAYTADIRPLKTKEINAQAIQWPDIYDVPIRKEQFGNASITGDFKENDIVAVACSVSEIDTSGKSTNDTAGFLSKNNCLIIGGLGDAGSAASKLTLKVGTTSLVLDLTGAHLTVAGVTINLFTHLHGTAVGPTKPPTPGT